MIFRIFLILVVSYLYKWSVALLKAVVKWNFFEVYFTGFPKGFLTLLFLTWKKFCDVGVMTLSHILVPTFLHLIILHVIDILYLWLEKFFEVNSSMTLFLSMKQF